ncbi:matrixin family metalloprotease, partial [Aquipuribacter hungaricus]
WQRAPALLGAAPPAPADVATAPLRLPPDVPDPGGYVHLLTGDDGAPVRWDPCRPVHVVVRPQGEPPGGRAAVETALARVGEASGLVFVVDGETDEAPTTTRALTDPARYGARWSPVLVAWSDAGEYPPLQGGAVGVAGPAADPAADRLSWVSGTVVLDAVWFADNLPQELGSRRAGAVLSHELAHLVGLGHSADPFSLMSPTYQSVYGFSLSDQAGLASLGGGACLPG